MVDRPDGSNPTAAINGSTPAPSPASALRPRDSSGRQAGAWLQSIPEAGTYKVPDLPLDRNYATVVLGARPTVAGLQGNTGISATTGQKRAHDATLFVNVSGGF